MQYAYDGQIKRYLTQFMRAMSLFSYKDAKGKLVQIPVRYGDMTRQVASIINKNSENMLQSTPFIACYIKDIQFDRSRLQDPTFVSKLNIRERAYDANGQEYLNEQGSNYTIERLMPSPFKITFSTDIWTSNFDQKVQIFEQMAVLFTPSLEIQTTDNFVDWTSLSVLEISSNTFETRTIPQGLDSNISVSTMTFDAPIWISPPAKVKKLGIITKIIANIFAEAPGTAAAAGYDDTLGYGDLFAGAIPDARVVVTPDDCELLVLNNSAKLLPIRKKIIQSALENTSSENKLSWLNILDLYPGKFTAGLSQLRLLKPDKTEIVATMSLNPENECEMILNFDQDTIPSNTILSDLSNTYSRGTVDAIIDPERYNPQSPAVDTRYLILEDINPHHADPGYEGPVAWKNNNGTDFFASANDIIQWDGSKWNVIFSSAENSVVTYITNSYTGIQYKWDNSQWNKSFEGVYSLADWRMVL